MSIQIQESAFPDGGFLLRVSQESVIHAKELFDNGLIESHIKEGFLCLSTLEYDLSVLKVPDLKTFLADRGLKASGKKADLISRIIESVPVDDIRAFVPDSYYLLTPKGKGETDRWQESLRETAQRERTEQQQKRIEAMKTYTPLIASKNFETVISFMRSKGVVSSSSDVYPEAIYFCLRDLNLLDSKHISVAVDYSILACDQKTIIDDMTHLGYTVDEETLWQIVVGTRSYADLLRMRRWLDCDKYQIHSRNGKEHCSHCQSFDGKIYAVNDAKIGVTLPPFCKHCNCYIAGLSE